MARNQDSPGKPLEVKLYMSLEKPVKVKLRAEGALLFPQIVAGSRVKDKYNDVAFFFLKYHNVFCPQTRDLFSAGSVAGKERGGNYTQRALKKIEAEMVEAAAQLPDELFVEYWGESVAPENRIREWLKRADRLAKGGSRQRRYSRWGNEDCASPGSSGEYAVGAIGQRGSKGVHRVQGIRDSSGEKREASAGQKAF